MKCYKNCSNDFYLSPEPPTNPEERKNLVPKCPKCESVMKPHCMFFDESYTEELYRSKTVSEYLHDKLDGLIVVGTAL